MRNFVRCATIRALRTFAQTMAATIGTTAILSEVDWRTVVSASALAALLSVLTSIAAGLPEAKAPVGPPTGPERAAAAAQTEELRQGDAPADDGD